jgi:hypothetical protein
VITDAEIHCPFGLGNRVAAMANGLSRQPEISIHWPVNIHCPVAASEMFPNGISGVTFLPPPKRPRFATRWGGRMAHDWDAAGDREAANAAYAEIMRSMVGTAMWNAPAVAVLGRFHRNPAGDPERLAKAAISAMDAATERRVFLLSDVFRAKITQVLARAEITVVQPECSPLAEDMRRTRADILDYACDWATLLSARQIIALDGPASALQPARAAGLEIIYA